MALAVRARCVARARATRAAWARAICCCLVVPDSGRGAGLGAGLVVALLASVGRARSVRATIVGREGWAGVGLAAGLAGAAPDALSAVLESDRGARTSATEACFAVVCDRRAACAWRVAVDFFAMLFSRFLRMRGCITVDAEKSVCLQERRALVTARAARDAPAV